MRGVRTAAAAVSAAALVLTGAASAVATAPPAHLTGSGQGAWKVAPGNPDTGTQHVLVGRGHFSIGVAKVRGSATSPGFIANGACTLVLRLVTSTGSIRLEGHSKHTSSSYPSCIGLYRIPFTTAHTSGSLSGTNYTGVARIDLEDASSSATGNGGFTLKLVVRAT